MRIKLSRGTELGADWSFLVATAEPHTATHWFPMHSGRQGWAWPAEAT